MVTSPGVGIVRNPVKDQFAGSGDTETGGVLNVPVAVNCTPAADPLSWAVAGLTLIERSVPVLDWFAGTAQPQRAANPRAAKAERLGERSIIASSTIRT
jgi:hypothetical protein